MPQGLERDLEGQAYHRAFMARLEAMSATGPRLVEQYQMQCAEALLAAGLTLIPSDHLRDHEYVVSRGVYEAAKKLIERREPG